MEFETSSIRTYREIRDSILSGELRPGEKLARRVLADKHGVSPITIMEAFYKLEIDGLVESRPMYGTRVRPLNREHFIGEQVMREALECQSARLCAVNLDERSAAELAALADFLDGRMGSDGGENDMKEHAKFHIRVAAISGVTILEIEIRKIFFREFMWATWRSAQQISPPEGWHTRLLDALRLGDPDQAEVAMREHVSYSTDVLLDLLETGVGD